MQRDKCTDAWKWNDHDNSSQGYKFSNDTIMMCTSITWPCFLCVSFVLRQSLGKDGWEQGREIQSSTTCLIGLGSHHSGGEIRDMPCTQMLSHLKSLIFYLHKIQMFVLHYFTFVFMFLLAQSFLLKQEQLLFCAQ